MQRIDNPDKVYRDEIAKFKAVVKDIKERHEKGQPILVGTASVENSEYLSRQLAKAGVRHEVLNAKNNEREAAIVAQAGRKGAVTVATNMAGRGTDIMLGGNPEFEAVEKMRELGLDPNTNSEEYEARWPEVLRPAKTPLKKSTMKSPSSVACTCSALSVTSPAVSTTSCAVVPAVRATRASPASTCR